MLVSALIHVRAKFNGFRDLRALPLQYYTNWMLRSEVIWPKFVNYCLRNKARIVDILISTFYDFFYACVRFVLVLQFPKMVFVCEHKLDFPPSDWIVCKSSLN